MIKIDELPPVVTMNTPVGIDIEVFGLDPYKIHRPCTGKFACMTVSIGDDVHLLTKQDMIQPALDRLEDGIWIFHNATFDITHLRRWAKIPSRKKIWDTFIVERIMWGGYFNEFGLDDLARRYLDLLVDKSLQKSFENANDLSPEQIQYAASDADLARRIYIAQDEKIDKKSFDIWTKVDRPAMWAVLDFQGFRINVDGWKALAEKNKTKAKELDEQLGFNPRSPKQVKAELIRYGFRGLPNTNEDTITQFIHKYPTYPAANLASQILEARMYSKRASTYGYSIIEHQLEWEDGIEVIHSNWIVTGAESGRMASSDPNLQNIPVRDTKEYRECFIARPKHKLIIGDWQAQEPRISAHLSQDETLLEIFNTGKDIYVEMGKLVLGKEIDRKSPERKLMKPVYLGMAYGLTKWGLAKDQNITVDEAETLLNKCLRSFPGYQSWMNQQQKKRSYVETVMGRRCWLNPYSNQSERNALNDPHQGTASDMMKVTLGELHQTWPLPDPFMVVAPVHDEVILDVPEEVAEEMRIFVKETMERVGHNMCPSVPFPADVCIADSWAEKG